MKNKKHFLIIVCTLSLFGIIFSSDAKIYDFSLETNFNAQMGVVNELVYKENGDVLSKLAWKQYITPQINLIYNARVNSVFFNAQLTSSIPLNSGIMEDFDYETSVKDAVTKYSIHDLTVDKSFAFKLHVAYRFNVTNSYKIQPLVGFSYQNRMFTAHDGYYQYAPDGQLWDESLSKVALTGAGISYEQTIMYPFVGFENIFYVKDVICNVSLSFFPYIFVDALDNHYLRTLQFYDKMRGGTVLNVGTSVYVPFKKNDFGLKFGIGYEYFTSKGTSAYNNLGKENHDFITLSGSSSGTNSNLFKITVGFVLNPKFWK